MKTYLKLKEIFNEASLTSDIAGILHWDMATMMPSSSRDQRSDQLAYLSKLSHNKISSSEVGDLIEDSKNLNLNNSDQKNLIEMDREYKLASAIPTELVEKISKSSAKCEGVWQEAREKSNFNLVKKDLEELINLTKEEANILGETFKVSPYEALINKFEPSSEENKISEVFDDLQKFLTPLIDKIIDKQKKEETFQFETSIDEEKQKNISEYIMQQIGFDFKRGRLDKSVHPFCGGSTNDVRITTRYNNDNPFSSLDGVMHETGHALYELNLPKDWMHQPVGKSRGMAMHESQSLLIEMQITRSLAFKKFLSNTLNNKFNIKDTATNPDNLYKLGTRVNKSFIRVESDEVTYPLHIILRFNLERRIFNNDNPFSSLDGVMHETGHALYELNLPKDWMHQPAGKSRGMAMHESQSLLIEMQITRSLAFKKFLSNTLNKQFNVKDKATDPDNLYKLGTRVNKSFIRVESDEVTYPLHIILRFNLERKIFNNEINIADIPEAWNDEFNRLFNLSINKDTDGCLQDIHWFAGLFGYFPTYSLGALTAAQFASQLRTDQNELDKEIENGEFSNLVNWLKKNIHEKASFFSTNEVLEQVTKSPLNAKYFKEYITNRYL